MFVGHIRDTNLGLPPIEKPPICDIVTDIAIKILQELTLTIAFGSVVACFVATPSGLMFMMSAAAVQLIAGVFFHSLGAYAAYKALDRDARFNEYEKLRSLCEWITGANFAVLTGFNTQTIIHESGHALAAMLIYKRPRPFIEVYPFVGGLTQFYKTGLTPFGKKLGASASTCFIVASGPGLTLLISSALLAIGFALLKTHPDLGKYLITWSGIDFLNHAIYAYSALGAETWNLSHDFVHLSVFGLHPMVATVGIVAIPILIGAAMHWNKDEPQRTGSTAQLV